MLANIWECLQCGEYFDCYWGLKREVCWIVEPSEVIEEHSFLYEIKNNGRFEELESTETCLCCDLPPKFCQMYMHPKIAIYQEDVKEYLKDGGITTEDVYSTGFSDCFACMHFKSNECVPLRNMIRFHNEAEVLPHFALSTCLLFEQEVYDSVGSAAGNHLSTQRGREFLATSSDQFDYLDSE